MKTDTHLRAHFWDAYEEEERKRAQQDMRGLPHRDDLPDLGDLELDGEGLRDIFASVQATMGEKRGEALAVFVEDELAATGELPRGDALEAFLRIWTDRQP